MNRLIQVFICIFTIIILILMASCSSQKKDEIVEVKKEDNIDNDKIVIGATFASSETNYQLELKKYIEKAAKERDVIVKIDYSDWDVETQSSQIYQYIEENVDAIILVPVNSKSLLLPLKEAKAKDIPVINLNMKVDTLSSEYIDTYVGASMSEEAALVGDIIIDMLGEEGGKVGIIEGAPGSDPQIYRTQTFLEHITPYPHISIVGIANGNWDEDQAYLAALDLIRNNKDLDVIYAHDSFMGMGAIRAIEELGLVGEIQVVGIGENEEVLKAVADGKLYGLVTQPPDFEGMYSVYCAIMAAEGKKLRPWYKNPVKIITQNNVKDYKSPMEEIQFSE